MNIDDNDEDEGRIARLIREAKVEDSDEDGDGDIIETTKKQMIGKNYF